MFGIQLKQVLLFLMLLVLLLVVVILMLVFLSPLLKNLLCSLRYPGITVLTPRAASSESLFFLLTLQSGVTTGDTS